VRRILFIGITSLAVCFTGSVVDAQAYDGLGFAEQVYDFGHIGIDFQVSHDFRLFNNGSKQVKIDSVSVPCECSSLYLPDSTIKPGDTVAMKLTFSTKDFYGLTSKSIVVYSNDQRYPRLELFYVSTIGQWLQGLKPDPISLFYIGGQSSKRVTLQNTQFDSYTLTLSDQEDPFIDVRMGQAKVAKGDRTEIDVSVKPELGNGTYQTNFRLKADVPGIKKPVYLTIPVKISRY
jgi:hypothetical protein